MKLIIFHYHLLPGGVTDVIRKSLSLLFKFFPGKLEIRLVCGNRQNTDSLFELLGKEADQYGHRFVGEIDLNFAYFNKDQKIPRIKDLIREIKENYFDEHAIWLVHNYHLGKNPFLTEALIQIAREGQQKIIFQIHDFPECARFSNLQKLNAVLSTEAYPQGDNIRYAVINQRDRELLLKAGMRKEELFCLENPVSIAPVCHEQDQANRKKLLSFFKESLDEDDFLLFYPVRSIRRKNILEAGLINQLFPKKSALICTLPGSSEAEKPYSDWMQQAFEQGLIKGVWGAGTKIDQIPLSFPELACCSDMLLSSSVQEGFGYLYFDALAWKKPLVARYLDILNGFDEIFRDFSTCFYKSLFIPAAKSLKKELENQYQHKLNQIKKQVPEAVFQLLEQRIAPVYEGAKIDFSFLSVPMQIDILRKVQQDMVYTEEVRRINQEFFKNLASFINEKPCFSHDRLEKQLGAKAYLQSFQQLIASFRENLPARRQKTIQQNMLAEFAQPQYFRLLYQDLAGPFP